MSFFDSDDSLIDKDAVFGKVNAAPLLSSDFKPWHKPRKQFIRDVQWLNQFKMLFRERKYKEIDRVNYFGLPGGDLLDINYIYQGLVESNNLKDKLLGFYGFINSDKDYQKAQGEMTKLLDMEHVYNDSKIDSFSFEDLSKLNSDAWGRLSNFGVYHFVNLDFCHNVITEKTLPSLYYLIDYQLKRVIGLPWLLCITTRLNKESTTGKLIEKFNDVISAFMVKNQDVSSKIQECFADVYKILESFSGIQSVQEKRIVNEILQICLVLWIIKESVQREGEIILKSSFRYSIDVFNPEEDMHSFVFYINRGDFCNGDQFGLVNVDSTKVPKNLDFEKLACQAITKLNGTLNVDNHLKEDKEKFLFYAEQMMSLLSKCGYDISGYKSFMSNNYGYEF
ncbi:TPA: hypothetical protein QIS87_001755 [Enterobacter bugandensis]|nr:hypothetical protein [Enterobacter bugandensis]